MLRAPRLERFFAHPVTQAASCLRAGPRDRTVTPSAPRDPDGPWEVVVLDVVLDHVLPVDVDVVNPEIIERHHLLDAVVRELRLCGCMRSATLGFAERNRTNTMPMNTSSSMGLRPNFDRSNFGNVSGALTLRLRPSR